jgi:hypothetical protein
MDAQTANALAYTFPGFVSPGLNDAPSVQIAKTLKNVDAYIINDTSDTAYVAQGGRLIVMRFGHPVTHDTEIWEQFFRSC